MVNGSNIMTGKCSTELIKSELKVKGKRQTFAKIISKCKIDKCKE